MIIFLRYIYKNMIEKKGRSGLLLLAIALSTAMLIASLGIVSTGVDILTKADREACENKDISIISEKEQNGFKINQIKMLGVKDVEPQILYSISYGDDNEARIILYGREKEYINQTLLDNKTLGGFIGKKCIISLRASQDYNLQVGDKITVEINNKEINLEIYGIAVNDGIFYGDTRNSFSMLLPYKFLAKELNMSGRYNYLTANKTEATIKESVDKFNEANDKRYKASLLYDENLNSLSTLTMPLYLMLGIIVTMSIIIIYSSFRLTITERLKVIGTFLSQGATTGTIKKILYLESIIYGLLGGGIGNLIGAGIISVTGYVISPLKEYGIIEQVQVPGNYYIMGICFSVSLALVSAALPIQTINKLQVKELILNTVNNVTDISRKRGILGAILLIAVIGVSCLEERIITYLSPILLMGLLIAIIMIMPVVIVSISKMIFKKLKGISPVSSIALNNVSTSKILINNITLMFISILVVIMINSVGSSLQTIVSEGYEKFNYDMRISVTGGKYGTDIQGMKRILRKTKEITSIQGQYEIEADLNDETVQLIGVDIDRYRNYDYYNDWTEMEHKNIWENFEQIGKRGAIITNKVAEKFNLVKGEYFKLEIDERTETFQVAGIINARMYNGNYFIIVNKQVFPNLYKIEEPSMFICTTDREVDTTDIKKELQRDIAKKGGMILTFEEVKRDNMQANNQIFVILNLFSLMALVISGLGVLNNISIGFIQRKQSMVVLSSVGMSVGQRAGMLIAESILTIFWPILIVCLIGSFSMDLLGNLISLMMGIEMKVTFDIAVMPQSIIIAFIIMVLATVPVIIQNRKFCIVEELKYE